jgi:hypothetical protein
VTLGLPLLESMVPAQTPLRNTAANPTPRVGFVYLPHGAIMSEWTPSTEGSEYAMTPTLTPLEAFRDRLLIVSGLEARTAAPLPGTTGGEHSRSAAAFLSGARPKKTAGADVLLGTTIDQVIAQTIGQETALPSIEIGIEDVGYTGICGYGYSCSYQNTISWGTPAKPLPMEINPQVVFERLFGYGATAEERLARKAQNRSILDSIAADVARLQGELPASDRVRFGSYLDDVREIERRLQLSAGAEADSVMPEAPNGVPADFHEHVDLMHELQRLAFSADITRVSTMMYSRDNSNRTYPRSGRNEAFHMASHHSYRPEAIQTFARINAYHIQVFADLVAKLDATPDGDGTLLDHSMILFGSTMSNGNDHDQGPLPILLAGGGAGRVRTGRHLRVPDHTPLSNLLRSVAHSAGVRIDSFGDSTGSVEI